MVTFWEGHHTNPNKLEVNLSYHIGVHQSKHASIQQQRIIGGASGIRDPIQNSNVFEKADAHRVEDSKDDDLEDTAEVHDDFDGMAGIQTCLYVQ